MKFTKYLFSLLIIFPFFQSCNTKQNKNEQNMHTDTLVFVSDKVYGENTDNQDYQHYDNFSHKDIKIFEPMPYNESNYTKQMFHIMDTILGLFKDDMGYKLSECRIEKVNVFENECYGGIMIEPTLNRRDNCLYLFRGLNSYKTESVLDTIPANLKIWVGESKEFIFNNLKYELKANGNIVKNSGNDKSIEDYWEDIQNYRLYLTCGNVSQCIVEMKKFNDTMTEIKWIGDLDGDKKPDFIISSPDWYEDYCVLLFLSSFAEENMLVKLVSVIADSFAC